MEKQLFLAKFIDQLEGHEGADPTFETEFRTIDVWDSLTGVAVQIMISDDFGSPIPDPDFVAAKTVQDLYDLAIKFKTE